MIRRSASIQRGSYFGPVRGWPTTVVMFAVAMAMPLIVWDGCCALDYCYHLDPRPPRRYATKTTYEDVRSNGLLVRATTSRKSARTSLNSTDGTTRSTNRAPVDGRTIDDNARGRALFTNTNYTDDCVRCQPAVAVTQDTYSRDGVETVPEDCQPVSLYVVARHGTRYTKSRVMDRITARLAVIRDLMMQHSAKGTMCGEDLEQLRRWQPRHRKEDDSLLSHSGWEELRQLGVRYTKAFGVVLNQRSASTRDLYDFRYTNYTGRGHRTRDSARAFAQGMWGSYAVGELFSCSNSRAVEPRVDWEEWGQVSEVFPEQVGRLVSLIRKFTDIVEHVTMIESGHPDWLLQFYEFCNKYINTVASRPVVEYEKFKSGTEMLYVLDAVNRRLGLDDFVRLDFDDLYMIFETCRVEHGLYGKRRPIDHRYDDDEVFEEAREQTNSGHLGSPWCSVLTPAMIDVLEYHQDIKYYWEDGYAHAINYEPACTLLGELLNHLTADDKLGRFRFTHSGTLDAFYARLGLFFDDQPIEADNFAFQRRQRSWSTTRIVPMAANVVFVKYRCSATNDHRVVAMVNERAVNLLGGTCGLSCPLEALVSDWRPIIANCDIERMCE